MASTLFLRQRAVPVAASAFVAGITLYPRRVHAEAPEGSELKKPIYDDNEVTASSPLEAPSYSRTETPTKQPSPTPTDRLAKQIGKSRRFVYAHVVAAENKVNKIMDSAFDLESDFVSTIASLAPSRESGERLMPGSLYVLVAAMTGSIVSRNRNIVLRAAIPLAVGVGAGWVVLPTTMSNISDLLWKYEARFPAVADGHIRTREGIEKAWRMARVHTQQAGNILDEKLSSGRETVEGWVKKAK